MNETDIENLLKQIKEILERHEVRSWAMQFGWFEKNLAATKSQQRQRQKINSVATNRRNFGGMGSFADLFIDSRNGHLIKPEEVQQVNTELDRLSNQLYLLVEKEISRFARNDNAKHE